MNLIKLFILAFIFSFLIGIFLEATNPAVVETPVDTGTEVSPSKKREDEKRDVPRPPSNEGIKVLVIKYEKN